LVLIRVGADFVVDGLCALNANSASDSVTLFTVQDSLDSEVYTVALCIQSRSAHLCILQDITHGTVVLGMFVSIVRLRGVTIRGGRHSNGQGEQD